MKPNPSLPERHLELGSRLLDGDLSAEEMKELASILETNDQARAEFVHLSEVHAMLSDEPEIEDDLARLSQPGNVVNLPGAKRLLPRESDLPESIPVTRKEGKYKFGALALAACLLLGLGIFYLLSEKPSEPVSPGIASSSGSPKNEDPEISPHKTKSSDPKEAYDRAVLATLGTGSQQRPPTNFTALPAGGEISFNRDIRPILSDNCFACHGPDPAGRKAKLRLDTEEGGTAGDHPAVVQGAPEKSELIARVHADDPDEVMPPPESQKILTDQQKELLGKWIAQGGKWEEHWAFIKPEDQLPEGLEKNAAIDHFVDEKLKTSGLSRSKEADKSTLARRVTLDLTGLPPTTDELTAFIEDESPDAYEKLVDRLLASKAYGEHRARYWLDAARYGDTHGLHLDNYREIWPYRDWVISAFNDNKAFDEFTREQIAGDLLPDATQDQRVATGFNRCNVTTSEGGAIEEEFLARYAVDRVSTTSTVWMGLTTGCAQCHDHKFDPITQKEFYQLYAYFNNTTQPGMDGNAKDSPPVIRVYENDEDKVEATRLSGEIASQKKALAEIAKSEESKFQSWLQSADPKTFPGEKSKGQIFWNELGNYKKEEALNLGNQGSFQKNKPFTISFRYKLPEMSDYGRVMLLDKTDAEQNRKGWRIFVDEQSMNVEFIEQAPNKVLKTGATRRYKSGAGGMLTVTYDGSGSSQGFDLYLNHQLLTSRFVNEWADTLEGDFFSDAHLLVGGKDPESGHIPVVNEIRLFDRALTNEEVKSVSERYSLAGLLKKEKRSADETAKLKSFYLQTQVAPYQDSLVKLSALESSLGQIHSNTPVTLVMQEKDADPMAHILDRGEYDQKLEEVKPGLPSFLPELDGEFEQTRLGLAKWLVHPEHPLTARVAVNRMWQELFGIGLVKTSEDFGVQGESPSHPELLDWLAIEFVRSGWDVKAFYKMVMLSGTYRQDSATTPQLIERDPENRLLARGPRFRLDAEVIRDQALAASGLLDDSVGGPSVKPYQPSGIWKTVGYTNSNTQTFFQDYGKSAEHRRTLYSFWKRTAPPPNMAIFDAPNREDCIVRRERTNTPLQALVLMNDPQFVRASRYLALRAVREKEGADERLDYLSSILRGRPMSDDEKTIVRNSLDQFRNAYSSNNEAARKLLEDEVNATFSLKAEEGETVELASWIMVANQLMNLDEVVNKN